MADNGTGTGHEQMSEHGQGVWQCWFLRFLDRKQLVYYKKQKVLGKVELILAAIFLLPNSEVSI